MRNTLRIAALLGVLLVSGLASTPTSAQPAAVTVYTVEVQPASLTIHGDALLDTGQKPSPTRVLLGASLVPLTVTSSSAT